MAVRHLKRYVSWVQTVQQIKYGLLNGLNPEVSKIRTDLGINKTSSRRRYVAICIEKLTNVGGILVTIYEIVMDNTEGNCEFQKEIFKNRCESTDGGVRLIISTC